MPALKAKDYLVVNTDGFLKKNDTKPDTGMVWQVVKVSTMPDGTPGVKIQRIQ